MEMVAEMIMVVSGLSFLLSLFSAVAEIITTAVVAVVAISLL